MSQTDSSSTSAQAPAVSIRSIATRFWLLLIPIAGCWIAIQGAKTLAQGTVLEFMVQLFAPMVTTVVFLVLWLFFIRQPWTERLAELAVAIAGSVVVFLYADKTNIPVGFILFSLPLMLTAWGLGSFLLARRTSGQRVPIVSLLLLLPLFYTLLIRIDGIDGAMQATINWRWVPTAEDRLLATQPQLPVAATSVDAAATPAEPITLTAGDWPGFRGENRDSQVRGVSLSKDWSKNPPKQLWKQKIGPGWSSFAVVGNRLYTQEQRGPDELVVCYAADTGLPLWQYADAVRFEEVVAGAGPRSTPAFAAGKLYTMGASGLVNCLDAATGKKIWQRNLATDTGAKTPEWGFSASPLIVDDLVVLFARGQSGKSLIAYKAATGEIAWTTGDGVRSYASVHPATLLGVPQLLAFSEVGLTSVSPITGESLWTHEWPISEGIERVLQPVILNDHQIIVSTYFDVGTRLIDLEKSPDGAWSTKAAYTSRDLKPYFNDTVLIDGTLYGFDGQLFAAVDPTTGKRLWKKGRYGSGQVLGLADQKLLIVLGEAGQLVLLEANPKQHVELGTIQAIEGKTWNHPVLAHGKLFVRNGEEMACFELGTDAGAQTTAAAD